MATEPRVSGRINVQALRANAEHLLGQKFEFCCEDGPRFEEMLALLDAVEAAHDFYDGDEKSGDRLRAAFARFDFGGAA